MEGRRQVMQQVGDTRTWDEKNNKKLNENVTFKCVSEIYCATNYIRNCSHQFTCRNKGWANIVVGKRRLQQKTCRNIEIAKIETFFALLSLCSIFSVEAWKSIYVSAVQFDILPKQMTNNRNGFLCVCLHRFFETMSWFASEVDGTLWLTIWTSMILAAVLQVMQVIKCLAGISLPILSADAKWKCIQYKLVCGVTDCLSWE